MRKFRLTIALFAFFISIFFGLQNVNAQVQKSLCLNFEFTRNLQYGQSGLDIYVLQTILNLDNRTTVALGGPGSLGKETRKYGPATRDAVKRFQALFIEEIKVADGKFNGATKDYMNMVCKSAYFSGGGGSVFGNTSDKIPPNIILEGPTTTEKTIPFRVNIVGSEAIKEPEVIGLIIDGANANDIRKISPTTFSFLVTPNEDNTGKISLQFEAEKVEDLAGNKNLNASNDLIIEVTNLLASSTESTTTIDAVTTDLSILNQIINDLPAATKADCSQLSGVSVYDYTNPCYGRTQMIDQGSKDSGSDSKNDVLIPFLTGLLKNYGISKIIGGIGSLINSGGTGGIIGTCMCPPLLGQKTIGLIGLSGPSGRFLMTANPTPIGGFYVGKVLPIPPPICGQAYDPKAKPPCFRPFADSTGLLIIGVLPPPPIFKWGIGF